MAAYAALVSLMHTMEQIQHHAHHPISLDTEQIELLCERITFLQEFLEEGRKGVEDLESRIADAAHAAEDAIDSYFVDQIIAESETNDENGFIFLCQNLQKVIQEMDFIRKEVMDIIEKDGIKDLQHIISEPAGSSRVLPDGEDKIVGYDDEIIQIMEKLTGQQSSRLIIPIVGMGGIGKTTFARNIYNHSIIVQHFDIRVWVTISQEYHVREILLEVLFCLDKKGTKNLVEFSNIMSQKNEESLGEEIYKSLWARRYTIIMDDMWSIEVWDKVQMLFPDNNNGSRIIVTTRLSTVANQLSSNRFEMKFLDDDNSWNLLSKKVFAQESCPPEFEQIGKKISKYCKGLPLSIIVIGGLLRKSQRTVEHWEYIAKDIRSIDEDEHCLRVLSLSYNQLHVHLKPCFLYMGIFPEDHEIRVSELIHLWVAEGFLKPVRAKNLEEIAEEFLKDLIDRNLVLVKKQGSTGSIKSCYIHDLLRDLCLKEAQKEKFLCVMRVHSLDIPQDMNIQRRIVINKSTLGKEYRPQVLRVYGLDIPQDMNIQRRIVINESTLEKEYRPEVLHALQSASLARSLICNFNQVLPSPTFRLLRVLNVVNKHSYLPKEDEDKYSLDVIFQLVNSRYLAFKADWNLNSTFPSSICLLRNVQTLIVRGVHGQAVAPSEFWDMPQLRHVKFDGVVLPDPPSNQMDGQDYLVLDNLQTLMDITDFRCSEGILKKIPNIRKLRINYGGNIMEWVPMMYRTFCGEPYGLQGWPHYCLDNLARLQKLESLACIFSCEPNRKMLLENLAFPCSLKKLTLRFCNLLWEDMTMIGSLPHLEVLKLQMQSFEGPEWNPIEGEFLCLKFLQIEWCNQLINWNADSTHFPRLEHIFLEGLTKLKEIPFDFGEIPTLRTIDLNYCSDSAVISAKNILEEQEMLGNVGLQVRTHLNETTENSDVVCNIQ